MLATAPGRPGSLPTHIQTLSHYKEMSQRMLLMETMMMGVSTMLTLPTDVEFKRSAGSGSPKVIRLKNKDPWDLVHLR